MGARTAVTAYEQYIQDRTRESNTMDVRRMAIPMPRMGMQHAMGDTEEARGDHASTGVNVFFFFVLRRRIGRRTNECNVSYNI